jgi:hypothetical protein
MAKMGRPLKPFDWTKLDAILQYNATLEDTATIMNVSEVTVAKRIRDKYSMTFFDYRKKRHAPVKLSVVQKAVEIARSGKNITMLIFVLKNLCNWSDNNKVESDNVVNVSYNVLPKKKEVEEN